MFKKILFIMIVIQGVLVSASVEELNIDGVKRPIIFEVDKNLPIASMQVIFQNSGSIEDGKHAGLARFSASILNEGTKKLGSVGFATALEDKAIHLSAHAGTETFVFEISALKEQFASAVKLLTQLLKDPNLSDESFKKIQILMQARIQKNESNFDYIASLNLKKALYHDTPIGHASGGTMESLASLKLEDVSRFIQKHLIRNSVIVVAGGDMDKAEASLYAKEILSVLPTGDAKPLAMFKAAADAKDVEVYKETEQAYVYFGGPYNLSAQDKDVYKAKVAAFILGAGGFGSRLMEEVRVKRGLAYSAYARVNFAKSHTDYSGHLQTKLASKVEAIKLVKEVIADFVKNGVSAEELEQAKKFLLGSEPLRMETLSQRLSRSFQEYYNGFKLGHSKEELKKIEALSLEDLNSFIKKHDEINHLTFSVVTKK
jgi:predicted Zn-dependent peptidase